MGLKARWKQLAIASQLRSENTELKVEIAILKAQIEDLKAEVAGLRAREVGRSNPDIESVTTATEYTEVLQKKLGPGHTLEITGGKDE